MSFEMLVKHFTNDVLFLTGSYFSDCSIDVQDKIDVYCDLMNRELFMNEWNESHLFQLVTQARCSRKFK